mgnify:CR=1 FL=1|jgi:hypothetical protein
MPPSLSVTALKRELKALGLDAKTPGLKGDARRDALQRRLQQAAAPPRRAEAAHAKAARVTSATISALAAALKVRPISMSSHYYPPIMSSDYDLPL